MIWPLGPEIRFSLFIFIPAETVQSVNVSRSSDTLRNLSSDLRQNSVALRLWSGTNRQIRSHQHRSLIAWPDNSDIVRGVLAVGSRLIPDPPITFQARAYSF